MNCFPLTAKSFILSRSQKTCLFSLSFAFVYCYSVCLLTRERVAIITIMFQLKASFLNHLSIGFVVNHQVFSLVRRKIK